MTISYPLPTSIEEDVNLSASAYLAVPEFEIPMMVEPGKHIRAIVIDSDYDFQLRNYSPPQVPIAPMPRYVSPRPPASYRDYLKSEIMGDTPEREISRIKKHLRDLYK